MNDDEQYVSKKSEKIILLIPDPYEQVLVEHWFRKRNIPVGKNLNSEQLEVQLSPTIIAGLSLSHEKEFSKVIQIPSADLNAKLQQLLEADFSIENLKAFFQTAREKFTKDTAASIAKANWFECTLSFAKNHLAHK